MAAALESNAVAVPGFRYAPDFLTEDEERGLLANIDRLEFREVRMHGVVARRTVVHFGWDYDYSGWRIHETDPPPSWLAALRDRAAAESGTEPSELEQFLIARYPPGASIGWHRDAPMFGSPVVGISLLSKCRMRFRRRAGASFETDEQILEPRSLYVLSGEARTSWQHHIPPIKELRYSITMRTIRSQRR
jgi:alkylated DNA repair dioxygenase AlkB